MRWMSSNFREVFIECLVFKTSSETFEKGFVLWGLNQARHGCRGPTGSGPGCRWLLPAVNKHRPHRQRLGYKGVILLLPGLNVYNCKWHTENLPAWVTCWAEMQCLLWGRTSSDTVAGLGAKGRGPMSGRPSVWPSCSTTCQLLRGFLFMSLGNIIWEMGIIIPILLACYEWGEE